MILIKHTSRKFLAQLSGRWLVLALTLWAITAHAHGQLSATVDRAQLSIEETLKLQVKYTEQVMFGEPDFSALQQNFDILARGRSHQFHNINGKTESWTQWTLTLAPLREGRLLIPSFEFKNSFSDAIEITVTEASAAPAGEQPVYLETELDKTSGYVQEQFLYTVRLFTSVDLTGLDRAEPKVRNALVKTVAENQYQRVIDGVPFGVVETTYAIFPQQSGTLEIPPVVWSVGVQSNRGFRYDPFLSQRGEELRLRGEARTLEVEPRPDSFTDGHWLPAHQVTLEQRWSQPPDEFKLGEPITRSITIRAQGLMASQLPPLDVGEISGVKYYPDQPQAEESVSRDGVTTVKTESYAIVPTRTGRITLPAVTLRWWDTQAKRIREATLPAHTITVAAAAQAIPDAGAMSSTADTPELSEEPQVTTDATSAGALPETLAGILPRYGWYAILVLLVTNVITLLLWLRARRRVTPSAAPVTPAAAVAKISEKQAYKLVLQALNSDDTAAMRQALLTWGRIHQDNPQLSSLQQLGEALPPLAPGLRQLEAALYSQQSTTIDTQALQQALQALRRYGHTTTTTSSPLPPLYATHQGK